jgi:hypothetical protein
MKRSTEMGEFLDQIPQELQGHIREITRQSGLPGGEDSVEKVAAGWLEKKKVFEDQIEKMNMEEVDLLGKDDERGALALTYSGSLVNIGPLVDNTRKVQYASIGVRGDVPDMAEREGSALAKDVSVDEPIEFENGPVKSTSQIFKIAVLTGNPSPEEQEEKITEATQIIQEEFVEVNKTIIAE